MNATDPLPLAAETARALESVTTATLTTVLLKKGLRNVWIRGAMPVGQAAAAKRRAGRAFTLRFVPAREDLATPASWGSPISTRAAIEAMPEGAIAVVDAMGIVDAGIFGDILCGGVAVMPNDVIVADGDGAVVVPAALLDEVLASALEQERLEGWIMREVEAGVPLPGLYPSNDATKARYEAWRSTQPRKSPG